MGEEIFDVDFNNFLLDIIRQLRQPQDGAACMYLLLWQARAPPRVIDLKWHDEFRLGGKGCKRKVKNRKERMHITEV